MFSGSARDRHRLPRINLGTRHVSLPDAAAAGCVNVGGTLVSRLSRHWGRSPFSICHWPRFITALQDCVMQIWRMRFPWIERDDHALVREIDFYFLHSGNIL